MHQQLFTIARAEQFCYRHLCILHGPRVFHKARIDPCPMHEYIWQGLEGLEVPEVWKMSCLALLALLSAGCFGAEALG
jgi:hypothetical protein